MATPVLPPGARPLRADARRNRDAILKAARAVFAKHGEDAQMDDVARRAGVGMGTVYRHFPTKEALVDALIADRVAQVSRFVEEGLDDPDPWQGLCRSMWRGAELGARDRGLCDIFGQRADRVGAAHEARSDLNANLAELVRRAQAAGQARPDLAVEDIAVVMCGVMNAMHKAGGSGAWKRHLQLALDGMSAGAASEALPER